jgi:hypothetical protein
MDSSPPPTQMVEVHVSRTPGERLPKRTLAFTAALSVLLPWLMSLAPGVLKMNLFDRKFQN